MKDTAEALEQHKARQRRQAGDTSVGELVALGKRLAGGLSPTKSGRVVRPPKRLRQGLEALDEE